MRINYDNKKRKYKSIKKKVRQNLRKKQTRKFLRKNKNRKISNIKGGAEGGAKGGVMRNLKDGASEKYLSHERNMYSEYFMPIITYPKPENIVALPDDSQYKFKTGQIGSPVEVIDIIPPSNVIGMEVIFNGVGYDTPNLDYSLAIINDNGNKKYILANDLEPMPTNDTLSNLILGVNRKLPIDVPLGQQLTTQTSQHKNTTLLIPTPSAAAAAAAASLAPSAPLAPLAPLAAAAAAAAAQPLAQPLAPPLAQPLQTKLYNLLVHAYTKKDTDNTERVEIFNDNLDIIFDDKLDIEHNDVFINKIVELIEHIEQYCNSYTHRLNYTGAKRINNLYKVIYNNINTNLNTDTNTEFQLDIILDEQLFLGNWGTRNVLPEDQAPITIPRKTLIQKYLKNSKDSETGINPRTLHIVIKTTKL